MPVRRLILVMVGAVGSPIPLGPVPDGHRAPGAERFAEQAALAFWPGAATSSVTPLEVSLHGIERRLESLASEAEALEANITAETAAVTRVLMGQRADPALIPSVASALVREGRRNGIAPELLVAVMLVENAPIDPRARSWVGAVGLMQIMPFHAGGWGCGSDLTDPDVNICLGARILATALERTDGDLDKALLRYNGCVLGTNTPDCHRYPQWVRSARAGVDLEVPGWPTPVASSMASNSFRMLD